MKTTNIYNKCKGLAVLLTAVLLPMGAQAQQWVDVTGPDENGAYEFTMPDFNVMLSADVKRDLENENYVTVRVKNMLQGNYPSITVDDQLEGYGASFNTTFTTADGESFNNIWDAPLGSYVAVIEGIDSWTGTVRVPFRVCAGQVVPVPGESYTTHYYTDDFRLFDENDDLKFYVVGSVNDNEVVLREVEDKAIPAKTPFLIFNNGDYDFNGQLIADLDEKPEVGTVAKEFKGTAGVRWFDTDPSNGVDYYVCDGHDFIYVLGDGSIAANRCWLELPTEQTAGARALTIVVGDEETTGIAQMEQMRNGENEKDAPMYNLAGQRVGKDYKGVVIVNGKKMVIK